MHRLILCFFCFIALFPVKAHADESIYDRVMASKTIRCGYFTWPPFMMKDPNTKKLSGLNYDVMEALGQNMGFKIDWTTEIGVGEVVAALNGGKFDALCVTVWPSQPLMQNVSLTEATVYSTVYAFVRAGDKRFDGDLEKANHKEIKVSGVDGDITADMAREKLPKATYAFLPQTASSGEELMYVVNKKADIAFVDQALVNDFLKTNPSSLRRVAGVPPVRIYGEHLAVKRGEYHLRDMLNLSLNQLINDGVIDRIAKKYATDYKSQITPPAKTFSQGRQ